MRQIIIISLALLSLGSCKKEESVVQKETTTTTTVIEPKVFYFAQDFNSLVDAKIGLYNDFNSPTYNLYRCSDLEYTLEDGVQYKIQMFANMPGGNVLQYEAILVYENEDLTISKTNGDYNMYWSDDCGMFKYLVK